MMKVKWGVVDVRDREGRFIAYHVMPVVYYKGEWVPIDTHKTSEVCQCNPFLSHGNGGWPMWNHFDPNTLGGMNAEEFDRVAQEAKKEWEAMQRLELEAEKVLDKAEKSA